ncbi:MAG: hypothetical protein DI613_18110 [Kocuria rhizophila]|nr:MAG: hypothetical protein DI613_18110 [Kocuria rhizophila]
MKPQRKSRGTYTAREAAEVVGTSIRTAQRWTAMPRDEWLNQMATEREIIRFFHDDEGHSWPETAKHFGLSVDTVKRRAYRARKERAEEELAQLQPPLPL